MKLLFSACVLLSTLAVHYAAEVRLLDLEPNDAQQIIEQQDQTLKYAPKIESNVPAVRYLGNEPHNVLEDIYLANQYHGQDGLGGYLYGYSVPDIAKTEKKKAGGDLRGAYNYIAGNGQEIKVEYWDDGTGFHQVDNVPKILPKQIDDTPEVAAAKAEHARIWAEQAERNSHPIANPYNNVGQYSSGPLSIQGQQQRQQQFAQQTQYQGQPSQNQYQQSKPQGGVGQYQGQPQGQFGQSQGQFGQAQGSYGKPQGQFGQAQGQFGKPQGQFGQAQGQLGQPQAQFGKPQGQYQAGQQSQSGQYQGQSGQYQGQSSQAQSSYNVPKPGVSSYGQQSQAVSQFQPKPVLTQTQDQNDIYSGQYTENRNAYAQGQVQSQQRQGQYQQAQGQYGQGVQGQYGQNQQGQYGQGQSGQYQGGEDDGEYHPNPEEEGVTGPPKGFFYSFDYPVGIIVSKDGGQVKREGSLKDLYSENKASFEAQLGQGAGHGGSYIAQ